MKRANLSSPCALTLLSLFVLGAVSQPDVASAAPAVVVTAAASDSACPALLNKTFPRLQDEKPQSLCQYSGQVILVVNTASYCGFTKQFKGLETLYSQYKDKGLVVLGFPSNDFGSQEPGSAKEIAEFCANTYGVKFPMFAKSHVVGDEANPLHAELRKATGTRPKWNFYKYLIGRDGRAVKAYSSMTSPDDRELIEDIEKQLSTNK
ncbi:MAG: glutathione peroxidase [Aquabacterium sp.]|uniref:glutathione peroxidase n=1 Tax=Aquabacterium sp. TaxID=1872578 RepID=UPI0025BD69B4|nr:glutathione peroxidase [Aquabacterium sp.]MBI5924678.1 glutathione peroxidase [Aquabacterium sp.]